jgi:hypothetical protein
VEATHFMADIAATHPVLAPFLGWRGLFPRTLTPLRTLEVFKNNSITQHRLMVTDVAAQPNCPIFQGQAIQNGYLTPKDGTYSLCRNVGN